MIGPVAKPQPALVEHLGDSLGDQIVLGIEVSVERAMREPGLGHQSRDADPAGTDGANGRRRLAQYPLAGTLFVFAVVTHIDSSSRQ